MAGGLVLGVGAAVTLASWTDEEWVAASFASGSFTLESSTSHKNGADFADHSLDGGSTLNFKLPEASKLAPNETLAAPLSLRLDADTTHDAIVTMNAESDQQIKGLNYEAIPVNSPEECSTGLPSNGAQHALGSAHAAVAPIHLSAGGSDTPGDPFTLCFVITADENLAQNQSAEASWTFIGESVTDAD